MKNRMMIVFITCALLLLAACGSQDEYYYPEVDDIIIIEEVEEIAAEIEMEAAEPEPITGHIPQAESWQEAYAALLRYYEPLLAWQHNGIPNGYFILHDIDGDGTPELLIFEEMTYLFGVAVYTFRDGGVRRLEFDYGGRLSGSLSAFSDGRPEIIDFQAAGSGGWYRRMTIEGDRIVIISQGSSFLTDEGFERAEAGYEMWPRYTEWHNLSINGEAVTVEEFEREFGLNDDMIWPRHFAITEANTQERIFGQPAPQGTLWQMAYMALLRDYMRSPVDEWHLGWRFILHDIDLDGIPELIILNNAGIFSYSFAAYTFRDGEVLPLEIDRRIWLNFYAAPLDGRPGIVTFSNSDGLASYMDYRNAFVVGWDLIIIDENRLVKEIAASQVYLYTVPENSWELYGIHWYINLEKVTEAEFFEISDAVLGDWDEVMGRFGNFPADITEDNIREAIFGWPARQISPFGREAAIEFLSGFPSIFQTKGLHDYDTGGFYALMDGGWAEIENLPPAEIPLVFQGGVRYGAPDNWDSDTWGAFFGSSFYFADGSPITDDVPFIRRPIWESDTRTFGTSAASFTLFDLNGNGIPEIVIEFWEMGASTWDDGGHDRGWGYGFNRPILLYAFVDGAYREIGRVPTAASSAGWAWLTPIFRNQSGEVIFYFDDGKSGFVYAYFLRFTDGDVYKELIAECDAAWEWFQANHADFEKIWPLTELQEEITGLLTEKLRQP